MISRYEIAPANFGDHERRQRLVAACPVVEPIFEHCSVEGCIPGVSFGVVVDSDLVFSSSVGTLTIGSSGRPDADSIFRIASMTKSFTAAAVLHLRDAGKLCLDDSISIYVPEFDLLRYPTEDSVEITVRDLLTMSSGWPQDDPWADRQLYRDDGSISKLYEDGVPFSNPPGTLFEYSNYGYMVLGRVITSVARESAIDYIERVLLKPLGMESTGWHTAVIPDVRRAQGYRWEDNDWHEEQSLPSGGDNAAFGGLHSTVRDLSRWVGLFQSAWPPRTAPDDGPLRRSSLREMQQMLRTTAPAVRNWQLGSRFEISAYGYGYGLSACHRPRWRSVGHTGGLPGFGCHMEWAPEHGVGVIALANVTYAKVRNACLNSLEQLISVATSCPRIPILTPALESAHDDICQLFNEWDETLADRLFADNFFLDSNRDRWKARLAELNSVHGHIRPGEKITPENWLRGQRRLHGERGWCEVWISLSPTVPTRIQQLKICSVLPPSFAMSKVAGQIVKLTECPARPALDEVLAPDCDRESVWNQLQLESIMYGQCSLREVIRGDGEHWAVFRLDAKGESLLLELHINLDGKVVNAGFTAEIAQGVSCFE